MRLGILTRAVPADQLAGELDKVLEDIFREAPPRFGGRSSSCGECETLTYQQGIAAATEQAILGVGLPEMRNGIAAFVDKQKASGLDERLTRSLAKL